MKRVVQAATLAAALAPLAQAGEFDGSKPLICATVEANECASGAACERAGRPADIGAPLFLRIDIDKRTVVGPKSTTPIIALEKTDQQILLQGAELGFAWSLALNQEDGTFSASLVNREGAIVLFGNCTPL